MGDMVIAQRILTGNTEEKWSLGIYKGNWDDYIKIILRQ